MKKSHIIHSCILMSALLLPASCSIDIDEYKEASPDGGNTLTLTASASDIVLEESESSENCLELSWSTGSNFGTGYAIDYTLEIDNASGDWSGCWSESMGRRTYSRTFTVEELNSILQDNLGITAGTSGSFKARVTAIVAEREDLAQTSEVTFSATTYAPVSETLYMIGTIEDNNWNVSEAIEMTRSSGGIFTWEGITGNTEFRFVVSRDSEWPGYIKDTGSDSDDALVYCAEAPATTEGINFSIGETSFYRITANLLELTVTVEDILTETLYLIGDATPGGWSLDELSEMTMTEKGKFTWTGTLTTNGEGFKFVTGRNFWPGYVKASDDADDMTLRYSETELSGDDDRKFTVDEAAEYNVVADLLALTVTVTKTGEAEYTTLYMIGDATSGGWSLGDATEMTMTEDGIYSWTGNLNSGSFRFVVSQADFAPGYWKANDDPDDMSMVYSETSLSGDDDRAFTISEAGEYTVVANTDDLILSITKTGDTPSDPEPFEALWILGTLNEWSFETIEKDESNRYVMFPTNDDPYIFTWTGDLTTGSFKISCDFDKSFFGTWYMPETANKEFTVVENEKINLVDRSSDETQNIDRNWNVTEAGNYTITINQLTERMTVTKN